MRAPLHGFAFWFDVELNGFVGFLFFFYFLLVADSITLPMSLFFNTHSSIFIQKLFAQVVEKNNVKWVYGHYTGDVHLKITTFHISFIISSRFGYQSNSLIFRFWNLIFRCFILKIIFWVSTFRNLIFRRFILKIIFRVSNFRN